MIIMRSLGCINRYFEAKTAEEEIPILDKWISEKSGDPKYRYGKQQFRRRFDPSSVEEDLGDDPVKASEYGRRNSAIYPETY